MARYLCPVCGWVYEEQAGDPANGIEPGTTWDALPEDFICPVCGVAKDVFVEEME